MTHEIVDLQEAEVCMGIAIAIADKVDATEIPLVREWVSLVTDFSSMCEKVRYRSSIAVLGNALLAKAANERIDVFSLKAKADHPGAYDARRTAEKILVPASQRYKFHLGVSGPQPLNNQPFFRHMRIESSMTVRENARPLLAELRQLLHRIGLMRRAEAVEALAGFIIVRRRWIIHYPQPPAQFSISTFEGLAAGIDGFVAAKSEGGGRAMACAAGIVDAALGETRVRLGKINEPDRKVPGDIGIRFRPGEGDGFERVMEIRDKAVDPHTIQASVDKAVRADVRHVTVLAVNGAQRSLDVAQCRMAAREIGAELSIFLSWDSLVFSLGSWTSRSELDWVEAAVSRIRTRMQDLGLAADSVLEWDALTALPTRGSSA